MYTPEPLEVNLINATGGTGTRVLIINFVYKTVVITFTGAGATTCLIEVSNDGTNWVTVKTATSDTYYESTISYKYIRARITVAGGKTVKADLTANR